jgi:hypothetical protein
MKRKEEKAEVLENAFIWFRDNAPRSLDAPNTIIVGTLGTMDWEERGELEDALLNA